MVLVRRVIIITNLKAIIAPAALCPAHIGGPECRQGGAILAHSSANEDAPLPSNSQPLSRESDDDNHVDDGDGTLLSIKTSKEYNRKKKKKAKHHHVVRHHHDDCDDDDDDDTDEKADSGEQYNSAAGSSTTNVDDETAQDSTDDDEDRFAYSLNWATNENRTGFRLYTQPLIRYVAAIWICFCCILSQADRVLMFLVLRVIIIGNLWVVLRICCGGVIRSERITSGSLQDLQELPFQRHFFRGWRRYRYGIQSGLDRAGQGSRGT